MQRVISLLESKRYTAEEIAKLKAALTTREYKAYREFKEANPTSRTAMDKVVIEAKNEDTEWKEEELHYAILRAKYSFIVDAIQIVEGMIKSGDYSSSAIDAFIQEITYKI